MNDIKASDPHYLHDMHTCLFLGRTPDAPVYWGEEKKCADMEKVKGYTGAAAVLACMFNDTPTYNRPINITFEKTMKDILTFLSFCLDIGHNPLSALRKAFNEFKWSYYNNGAGDRPLPEEIVQSNYIWYLGGDIFYASKAELPHKFCFAYQDKDEMPPEVQADFKFANY